jgi:hypothetical protein
MIPDITNTGTNDVINKLSCQLVKNETRTPPMIEQRADEINPS